MYYIGIDPGLEGAVAIIDENGVVIGVHDIPTRYLIKRKKVEKKPKYLADGVTLRKQTKIKQDTRKVVDGKKLFDILSQYTSSQCRCALEFVSSHSGQGVKSTFSFGESFGCIKGVLESIGIDYNLLSPMCWQGNFALTGGDKSFHKERIMNKCKEYFPDINYYGKMGGVKYGRSDALLIAKYYLDMNDSAKFVA